MSSTVPAAKSRIRRKSKSQQQTATVTHPLVNASNEDKVKTSTNATSTNALNVTPVTASSSSPVPGVASVSSSIDGSATSSHNKQNRRQKQKNDKQQQKPTPTLTVPDEYSRASAPPSQPQSSHPSASCPSEVPSSQPQSALDEQAKKAQSATLFSLMTAYKQTPSASPSSTSKQPKQQGKHKGKKEGRASAATDLANFDLSSLIQRSQQHSAKQQQQRRKARDDADVEARDEEREHQSVEADLHLMNSERSKAPTTSPAPPTTVAGEFKLLYEQTKADEVRLATLLQQLQNSKDPSSFATRELRMSMGNLRTELREKFVHLIRQFPANFIVGKNIILKLWTLIYKELQPLLDLGKKRDQAGSSGVSKAKANGSPQGFDLFEAEAKEEEEKFTSRLSTMLDKNERLLDELASIINSKYHLFKVATTFDDHHPDAEKPHSKELLLAAKQVLSGLCVCQGDLNRYYQQYIAEQPDWNRCMMFYERSLMLDPFSTLAAKSHNQLAVVWGYRAGLDCSKPTSLFEQLYRYTRAMHTPVNPFPARENLLQLFEENRSSAQEIINRLRANMSQPKDDMDVFLTLFIHLLSIIDTNIGWEQFDFIFKFAIEEVFKKIINEDFFAQQQQQQHQQGAQGQRITEQMMMKLMTVLMQMTETFLLRDAEKKPFSSNSGVMNRSAAVLQGIGGKQTKAKHGDPAAQAEVLSILNVKPLTPTTAPPFALCQASLSSLRLLYELVGTISRLPTMLSQGHDLSSFYTQGRTLPFLPCLCLSFSWCASKFGWIFASPFAEALEVEEHDPVEYARAGLAMLAKVLHQLEGKGGVFVSSEVSLLELQGFQPLMSAHFFPRSSDFQSAAVDSFEFQCHSILSFAKQVLFSHHISGRFSAFPIPAAALSVSEMESLKSHQESWLKAQAEKKAIADGTFVKKKKKRASKQAKPRPWQLEAEQQQLQQEEDGDENVDRAEVSSNSEAYQEEAVDDDSGDNNEEDAEVDELNDQLEVAPLAVPASTGAGFLFHGDEAEDELEWVDPAQLQAKINQATTALPTNKAITLESMLSDENMGIIPRSSPSSSPHQQATSTTPPSNAMSSFALSSTKPLMLLDCANICMAHGKHKVFSVRGLEIVVDFFRSRGFRTLAFLPDSHLNYEQVGAKKRAMKLGFEVNTACMPDNMAVLNDMKQEGTLIATPAGDYDDSYLLEYAMGHSNALVVSNDKYRDHIDTYANDVPSKKRLLNWIHSHVISFTFVHDRWQMNPEWRFDSMVGLKRITTHKTNPHWKQNR